MFDSSLYASLAPPSASVGVVYGVRQKNSLEYRYIGQTTKVVERRLSQHLKSARDGRKTPFYDWLRRIPDDEIQIDILESVSGEREDLGIAEMAWISYQREKGDRLLNIADGGLGPSGVVWTAEQREAASRRALGRPGLSRPGELNPFYGGQHSSAQKEKWSRDRKGSITGAKNPNFERFGVDHPSHGRVWSRETLERLSAQKRGAKNPNYGKVASEATRMKRSAAQKGVPKPASARSAHTRWHTQRGVVSPTCKYCAESSAQDN